MSFHRVEFGGPVRRLCLLLLAFSALSACVGEDGEDGQEGTDAQQIGTLGSGPVTVSGVEADDPVESIHVTKVGHGSETLVLLPGNNTSGQVFHGMLNLFRGMNALNERYTVYTFDYRGSGDSSYNTPITAIRDFAVDFQKVIDSIEDFPTDNVTLIGYSMGFAVALEMVIADPNRYDNLIGLAPVGTRGTRVQFNASSAGTDDDGNVWQAGDFAPIHDDALGIATTAFHQRSWQGENRTFGNVQFTWDFVVFNDVLEFDPVGLAAGDPGFRSNPDYLNTLFDVLSVQYMPESLYYIHKFNVSQLDGGSVTNGSGLNVTINGDGRLGTLLMGKNVLLLKATTDYANWRGDLVITDNIIATSKYDLKQAGATTTAIMIDPDQGYDHGMAVTRPGPMVNVIDAFLQGTLDEVVAESLLSATVDYHAHTETTFETPTYTGL